MKRFICIAAGLLAAALAQAQDARCFWSGSLDNGVSASLYLVIRTTDGLMAGTVTKDNSSYQVIGQLKQDAPNKLDLEVFSYGHRLGELVCNVASDMSIEGSLEVLINRAGVKMTPAALPADAKDPFVHRSMETMFPITVFSSKIDHGEAAGKYKALVIAKTTGGLAFETIADDKVTGGTVLDFDEPEWNPLPYEDGKLLCSIDGEPLQIEIFNDFAYIRTTEKSPLADAAGAYSYKIEDDKFSWGIVNLLENDEESDEDQGGAVWTTVDFYADMVALEDMIKANTLYRFSAPVDLEGAAKPGILTYFHALAKALPGGLLGEALKAERGQTTELPKAKWTLDARNGYIKFEMPDQLGTEGLEMCFWRGKDGRDVIALNGVYDRYNPLNFLDCTDVFLLALFRYDPVAKTLTPVSTVSTGHELDYSDGVDTSMHYDNYPNYVKLPREGKAIEFLDFLGKTERSAEWSAEEQWFIWKK